MQSTSKTFALLACALMLAGCTDDKSRPPEEAASMKQRIDTLAACTPTDVVEVTTWIGPGFDENGKLREPLPEDHVEALAQGWRKYDAPADQLRTEHGGKVLKHVMGMPGFIGFQSVESVQCDISLAHTLWRDESSMLAFVTSDPHATAMQNANKMHHAFAGAHWFNKTRTVAPTWQEGIARWAVEARADLP